VREFAVKLAAIHRQKTQAYQGLRRGFLPKKRGEMRGKGMCAGFLEVPVSKSGSTRGIDAGRRKAKSPRLRNSRVLTFHPPPFLLAFGMRARKRRVASERRNANAPQE
jgi:hypothetical protein